MVRYRLGCRRGGNGRRGGLATLWAKARTSVAAVSLRLILAMLRNESGRRYRRCWSIVSLAELGYVEVGCEPSVADRYVRRAEEESIPSAFRFPTATATKQHPQ